MGKNKLARWNELGTYRNVIQPSIDDVVEKEAGILFVRDHAIKGKWQREMFMNNNPVVLELGCGKGEYTTGLAIKYPGKNFIGVDIKGARMWRGARTSSEMNLENAAFLRTRIEFISSFFAPGETDEIWITFPDPHTGARNANKRLTSPYYLRIYSGIIRNKGIIHLKTDNSELYNYTVRTVKELNLEIIHATDDLYSGNLHDEILSIRTHYEKIFLKEGLKIKYLSFILERDRVNADKGQKER